jgi:FKBP-type peptidyl-prolyl cis-trans isomerase (trigger factor)
MKSGVFCNYFGLIIAARGLAMRKRSGKSASIVPSGDVCFELFRLLQHQKSINYGKDNKTNVPVPVGKGLFSRELESRLIGLEKGEKKILTADGHAVEVEIVRISHTVLPELTDENVAAFGIDGVATVDDLRRYCIAKQVDGFLLEDENPDMASAFVWQEVAKRSRIQRDESECAHVLARADAKLASLSADEDDGEETGIDPEMMRNIYLSELDLAAVGAELMSQDGKVLTMDDYTSYIDKLVEAYPDRTRAEIEADHGVEAFAISEYADYLAQVIDGYVAGIFKKVLAK